LFEAGDYAPLTVKGAHAAHVIAYQRRHADDTLIVVAGRLFAQLGVPVGDLPVGEITWSDTVVSLPNRLAGQRFVNVLSGDTVTVTDGGIRLAQAFEHVPVAAFVVADAA
jgi:(1->4)-alpha-D-glucan 1-alpha-D-glucosylmutase